MTQSVPQVEENNVILTGVFCGIGVVFIFVFLVFQCVCCKKQNSRSNDLVKGSSRRVHFRAVSNANSQNGIYETEYANESIFNPKVGTVPTVTNDKRGGYRCMQNGPVSLSNRISCSLHRALPAPPVPSANGSIVPPPGGNGGYHGNGTLTRESSTSELYASVDKQQPGGDRSVDAADCRIDATKQSDLSIADNRHVINNRASYQPVLQQSADQSAASHCQSHLYAKICDDHLYSKIWYPPNQEASADTYDNLTTAEDSDFDPFYSKVNEDVARGFQSSVARQQQHRPPPPPYQQQSQRPPPFRRLITSHHHAYEYPRFAPCAKSSTGRHGGAACGSSSPKTSSVSTDPFYSKVGSEDPYSSIKSEEHYSRVDREEDSLSAEIEFPADDSQVPPSKKSSCKTGGRNISNDYDDNGWYADVPGPSRVRRAMPVYRRRSDGDEYAMVRKGSAGMYSTPARSGQRPPPVPQKRFDGEEVGQRQRHPWPSGVDDDLLPDQNLPPINIAASGNVSSKKEPSYRYITVRESLDALRERMMDQQQQFRRPTMTSSSAVYAAISDPSLHYYSTISEHSYEVVPPASRNQQDPSNSTLEDTVYIDQEEMDNVYAASSRADIVLRNSDLNTSIQSDESSTVRGSHVTLVQIDAVMAKSDTSGQSLEPQRPSSVPPTVPPPIMRNNTPSPRSTNHDHVTPLPRPVLSCIPKSLDNQQNRTSSRAHSSSRPHLPNGTVVAAERFPAQPQTCASKNSRSTSGDSEYPTTLCFCHAPKSTRTQNDKQNFKKRSPDHKRDSRF